MEKWKKIFKYLLHYQSSRRTNISLYSPSYFISGIINIVWDLNYTYNFIKCPLNYINYVSSYHYRLCTNIISSPIEPSSSLILITLGCFQNFTIMNMTMNTFLYFWLFFCNILQVNRLISPSQRKKTLFRK